LVVIGNGEPHYIKPFRDVTGYSGLLFTDATLAVFKRLGFRKGLGSLIGLKTITGGLRAAKSGHAQDGIQGSLLQQGGALVVGPGNSVHYYHRNREPGDHPPVAKLIDACNTS
jgi:hypothetical protein